MGYGFQTTYAHFQVSNLSMDAIDGNAAKRWLACLKTWLEYVAFTLW